MAASHQLAQSLERPGFPLPELQHLQDWQRRRLAATYADLLAQEQYQAAGRFFLSELYGGLDFQQRDQQVERVMPVMTRVLPRHMLLALARAFELQVLSLSLDSDMAAHMSKAGINQLRGADYARIYTSVGRIPDRMTQLQLITELGAELIDLVRHRLVLRLVRLLRGPARAAGFSALQDFLEEGLIAFQSMEDGWFFIETIRERETSYMQQQIRAGHQDSKVHPKCSDR